MGRLVKIDDSKRGAAVYQSTVTAPRTTASATPTAAPRTVSGTEAAKSLQASIDAVRKSRNHGFERSGKTRDAYDSSVRSGYRQRQQGLLEQATDAGTSNGGMGSMGAGTSGGNRGGRTPSKLRQFGWAVEDTIDKVEQATQDFLNLDLYLKNKEDKRKAEIASGAKNDNGKNASAGQIAGNSIRKGMAQANKAFTSGLDFIMPTDFLGKYDPFSNLSNKYKDIYESIQEQQAYNLADRSKATKLASEVGSFVVSALPNALLSIMSSGYSAASQLAPQASGISSYIMNGIQSMSKNPMYWTSFVNTVGNEYENAVANGAGKTSAALAAITSSLINSGIEVVSGIETLPGELRNGDVNRLAAWFKSGLEEGMEGLWQGGVSNAVNKLMVDNKAPVFSTTDENAVINPKRMANEFGMGAATGLILSGGQLLATPGQQGGYKDEIRAKGAQTNPELQQVLDSVNEAVENGQRRRWQANPEQAAQAEVDNYVSDSIAKSRFSENPVISDEKKPNLRLGTVSEDLANQIQSEYGVDISGKRHVLSDNDLRHIFNRHGPHTNEQFPVTVEDLQQIPDILQNYDEVYYVPRSDGKHGLFYEKRHNGTTYYLEQIMDNGKDLQNKQMIKVETGTIPDVPGLPEAIHAKSANSLPGDAAEAVPQMYVQDVRNGAFSNNSIPQSQTQNNPNFDQNHGGDTGSPVTRTGAQPSEAGANREGGGTERADVRPEGRMQQSGVSSDAVGAAEAGFDASIYNRWVNNAEKLHEPGEHPVRNASLPTENLAGQQTMKTGQTIMEAGATPDGRVETIENMYLDGALAYTPQVDAELAANAEQTIEHKGWQTALNDWTAEVRQGKVKPELVAMGAQLLNNMGNSDASTAQYADLVADYSMLLHNAGQSLQAARILKTLTPEGRLYCLQRSIDSINEKIKKESGIELDEGLLNQYRAAETDEARDAVLDRMKQDVADKMPSTLADKWTALRYVNMLGNLKTQGRNLIGNVGMGGLRAIKDEVGAVLEAAVDKFSGGKLERTKSVKVGQEWMKAATADFATVEDAARGNGRLQEGSPNQMMQDINDKRTIFKNNGNWGTTKDSNVLVRGVRKATDALWKVPEAYRKVTNWATDAGDVVFIRHHYARALAGYLKANGVKVEAFLEGNVDADLLERARTYAIREAQEATFHDNNAFSNWVSKIGRRSDTPKAAKAIAEGVAPFRKTPANVLVRAYEYSPLGFIDTIAKGIQTTKGNATASDVINSAARSLTGTGLLLLGMALRATGNLTASPDEDDREIDSLLNRQDYAITIGGHSYTMDWLSPMMLPVFMGGVLEDIRQEKELTWSDLDNVVGRFGDPLLNMSMLSGVDNALNSIKYSDNGLLQLAASFGLSYLTQGFTNSLLGQIERSTEKNRMTTYTDQTSSIPSWLQQAAGNVSAKILGWDYNQTEYLDEFGRTESNGSLPLRIFENILSPGYHAKSNEGEPVYSEMQRIYEETGQTPFPSASAPKKITVDKQDYTLSQEQREQYQKTLGGMYYDTMNEAAGLELYRDMTGEERAEFAADVKELATAAAQAELRKSLDLKYENSAMEAAYKAAQEGASVPEYLAFRVLYDQAIQERKDAGESYSERAESTKIIEQMKGLSDEARSALWESKNGDDDPTTVDERNPYTGTLAAQGVSVDDIIYLEEKYKEIQNIKEDDGSKDVKRQAMELSKWLDSQDYTDTQRKYIESMYDFWGGYKAAPYTYDYKTMTDAQKKIWDSPKRVAFGYTDNDIDKFIKNYSIMNSADKKQDKIKALQDSGLSYEEAQLFYRMTH